IDFTLPSITMPKRKLSELNVPARSDTRKLSIKAVRLTTKFDHGVLLISRGLKTARGFERQKLSRREKTAKSDFNRPTLARLAEEVEALKALDYQVTAERYLFKQLSKTKRIAETATFKEFSEAKNVSTEGPKSSAESNVLGRLFKSTPVKNVMPDILDGIRKLLGVEDAPAGKSGKAGAKSDAAKKEKSTQAKKSESIFGSEDEKLSIKAQRKENTELDSDSDEDMNVSAEEMDFDSDDLAQFDSRLAPGSDVEESADDEEMADLGGKNTVDLDDISDSASGGSPDISEDEQDEEEEEEEEEQNSPPPKKSKGSKASAAPAQSTTFLPSLMMGGYWSGSEEASDDEQAAGPPKRKNRMGQQARRALWEKKYGAQAKHIQEEQKKQKRSRDNGWDTRKGATDGSARGGRAGQGGSRGRGGFGGNAGRYNQHSSHDGKPKGPPKDQGPLHPSWEAKRKLKEQATTATFQGKKVVFD
ncbi:hypothetical protein N7462_010812, partial [Penicillium macrosclerotiorum]|uniref:uncharacterized protein n=1 Tax=Penicillium macrosclerotiorum TaxID=303699 RepID=UPI002546742A